MIPIILSLEKHGVDIIHDSLCKKLRKNDERVLSVHSKQQREFLLISSRESCPRKIVTLRIFEWESRPFYG
jgi:hypothetical protein